jgi:transmembrane sensor
MPAELRTERRIEEEAVGWVIRLRDADEQGWAAFTDWLEADPRHAAAYDDAAVADAEAEHLPAPEQAPMHPVRVSEIRTEEPRRGFRRSMFGWAAAASIVLSVGSLAGGESTYLVETGPGERRVVALEDGSRIRLNGGTRVELDEERPRFAKLERGEALFEVVHDASRPFEVQVGATTLRDLGTVFNVVAEKERLEVAVSEGIVLYDPQGAAKKLTPGMALRKQGKAPAEVERISSEAVGGWRAGRLIYSAVHVAEIASDLSRNLGIKVAADEAVASRSFSGVILLDGKPNEVLARSAALLGLELQQTGETWWLKKASAPD